MGRFRAADSFLPEDLNMRGKLRAKAAIAAVILSTLAGTAWAAPLGTQFTYQGEIRSGSGVATGPVDLRIRLYDAAVGGALVGTPTEITILGVALVNGRFTRTLDFGAAAYSGGQARWLEIDVRNAGGGAYTTLPRQELTASPFARYAQDAGTAATANNANQLGGQSGAFYQNANNLNAGTVPNARLGGTYGNAITMNNAANVFAGNGAGLTGLNAGNISTGTLGDGLLSANVALLNRNPQTFTGNNIFGAGARVNGFFGVNTATPIGSANVVFSQTAAANTYNGMYVNGTDAGSWPFYGYATNGAARAWTFYNGTTNDWQLVVNAGLTNAITVESNGNVGLGNSDAAFRLDVSGRSRIRGTDAGATTPGLWLNNATGGDFSFIGAPSVNQVGFFASGPVGWGLNLNTSDGKVGIGTLGPTHRLTVVSGDESNLRLVANGSFGSNAKLNFGDSNFVFLHEYVDDSLKIQATGTLLLSGGDTVYENAQQSIIFKGSTGVTPAPELFMFDAGTANDDRCIIAHSPAFAGWGLWYLDGSDVFQIKSSATATPSLHVSVAGGLVGIGNAAPTHALTIQRGNNDTLRLIGAGASFGFDNTLNFGDGDFTFIREDTDDHMLMHARLGIQSDVTFTAPVKNFTIDHPLDPANKTLAHSSIESDEYKNMYDGIVTTDDRGYATITMPSWFGALNENFRYQLTIVDEGETTSDFVLAKVVQKMDASNTFVIKTSVPNMEVSWQVTGTRKDAFVKAHPLVVEAEKSADYKGRYITPVELGKPASLGYSSSGEGNDPYTKNAVAGGTPEPRD